MSEYPMFRDAEFLKQAAPLPVLSPGLRSRVLAAALEAQDRRSQGRRVLASALGMFVMLVGVAWMRPFSNGSSANLTSANGSFSSSGMQASAESSGGLNGQVVNEGQASAAPSVLSSLNRGQGLMSIMGDDWQDVQDQLQSRQEHFPRFHM